MSLHAWLPSGGGDVGNFVRSHDWSRTPLGPIGTWPATIRTIVQTILVSPVPMATLWGPQGTLIYNEGYALVCGPRHPAALGGNVLDVWPEARTFNAHVIETTLAGGNLSFRAQELELLRHGHPERVWMDLDYMPVLDDDGVPIGALATVIDVTERILTEQSLRDKEARFRAFVNATNDMVYRMSPDWQELRELDGRGMLENVETPTAAWLNDYVVDEDRERVQAAVERAVATREPFEVEARVWQRDGSVGWILSRAVPFVSENGELYEWFGAASDITERKLAEIALANSEARFRGIFESRAVGFSIFDVRTGESLALNDQLLSMTGHTREDYQQGRWDWRHFTPDDQLHLDERAIEQAREKGYWDPFEKEFIHRDGTRIPVRLSSAPLPGEPGRLIGVVQDLTEEKAAEAALRHSEEQLRLATDAGEIGLWDVDPINQRLYWQHRVKSMFGVQTDRDVSITDFYEGLHPDDRERVIAAFEAAADPQRRLIYDVEYRTVGRDDGVIRWVAAKGKGFFDAGGTCVRLIGTALDITARKQGVTALAESEARLRELNETLEERIHERGLELERAHESLRQAQKMQALGQLTGGIAHDFNNVLQALVGSLSLISRRPGDSARVEEFAKSGLHAAQRGAKLTAQLLAFSRAQKMEVKPVAVVPVLTGLGDMIGKTLGPTIRLVLQADADDFQVMADETQLEMALLNLAVNARDAMPNGGTLKLTAALKRVDGDAELQSGQYLEIAVADSGTGMSPDVAARAFEPFFTTKGIGKGTGLGLSQVFGMASQAGGTVRIDSAPGRGTTVRLLLKLAREKAEAAAGPVLQSPANAAVNRVLVIDDDPDVRNFLASALQALGYQSDVAEDGPSGLQRFQEYSPEVVIIDYLMPIMSGAEVAQVLRTRQPDIPIIFASGYSETKAIEDAVAGDAIILRKPFTLDQLNLTINRVVRRGAASEPLPV